MRLHIQTSDEARRELESQQKKSSIFSVMISFLVIILIGMILSFVALQIRVTETPAFVTYVTTEYKDPDLLNPIVKISQDRNPSSPSQNINRVIVSNAFSDVAIPTTDELVAAPSLNFGSDDGFGDGWSGSGSGDGSGFKSNIPLTMNKRCSPQDRLSRLTEMGGSAATESAVVKALTYLKNTQKEDGSWETGNRVGMTGLALLTFLGHCETPKSPEYGPTVEKAILHLVNVSLKNKGRITTTGEFAGVPPVYEHAIATYALAEAYTLCRGFDITIPELDKVVKEAGDIILKGQTEQGSWVYGYGPNGGDNSVGFWQIQALKACKHTGLWSDGKFRKPIKNALKWLEDVQGNDGSIGYRTNSAQSPGLTGGGVLCFQLWDEGKSDEARDGIKYIKKNVKFDWEKGGEAANLYYHYYHAQAMINHGGEEWTEYNNMFKDSLVSAQKENGSWSKNMQHGPVNDHMATCLATLMLEVYYRFLPGTNN